MKERALAVDLLRGLAIVGMVLSGYISRNPDLPAWLFHAQLPPPSFAFDPSVPGITWVDLVFPFFLFSMGAAFPFSIGRRLDRGAAAVQVAWTILRRGLLLAFFAIVLGNTNLWTLHEALQRPVAASLLTLVVWGAFFAMFIRLRNRSERFNTLLNGCGIAALLLLLLLYRALGVDVNLYRSDIIILILANVVVAGSFLWWLTRRKPGLRMGLVALLVALKLSAAVPGSWTAEVWNATFAPWLYHTEFLQYLCIVLPGSVAGELIARWLARKGTAAPTASTDLSVTAAVAPHFVSSVTCTPAAAMPLPDGQAAPAGAAVAADSAVRIARAGSAAAVSAAVSAAASSASLSAPAAAAVPSPADGKGARPAAASHDAEPLPGRFRLAGALVLLLLAVNLWGLYVRALTANLLLTLLAGGAAAWLLRRPRTALQELLSALFATGLFWLLLGLVFEPLEGGIKKDPATVSYFFVTAGMASHVLLLATLLFESLRGRAGLLVRCGENPMIAYTAAGYVVVPLLFIEEQWGFPMPWIWGAGGCGAGIARGVVVTLLAMLLTSAFTRRRLFWRT